MFSLEALDISVVGSRGTACRAGCGAVAAAGVDDPVAEAGGGDPVAVAGGGDPVAEAGGGNLVAVAGNDAAVAGGVGTVVVAGVGVGVAVPFARGSSSAERSNQCRTEVRRAEHAGVAC